jgi:hypothetical protein
VLQQLDLFFEPFLYLFRHGLFRILGYKQPRVTSAAATPLA